METLNEKYKQDFNTVFNIYANKYSYEELIKFLKSGNIAQKQASALKLDYIKTKEDADIFIKNLTGCDGKIREAVSFRLPEFVKKSPELFNEYQDIFLDAVIDINGNICRNTINALKLLKEESKFCESFCKKLMYKTLELSEKVKAFDIQDRKYKVNKEVFKLYWYLETVYEFVQMLDEHILAKILINTSETADYTIREKAAKILSKIEIQNINEIKEQLKKDKNYYVRRF